MKVSELMIKTGIRTKQRMYWLLANNRISNTKYNYEFSRWVIGSNAELLKGKPVGRPKKVNIETDEISLTKLARKLGKTNQEIYDLFHKGLISGAKYDYDRCRVIAKTNSKILTEVKT